MLLKCRRGPKRLLHVGCGSARARDTVPVFADPDWQEVRLDVDPHVRPDVVASITDMRPVPDASVDGVLSAHNLEHLFAHEVPVALREFRRVLRPGGFALIFTPDLQAVAAHVARGELEDTLYVSPAGPIAAADVLYGLRRSVAAGNHYMAHKTGFTEGTLRQKLAEAGLVEVEVGRDRFELHAIAYRR